MICAKDSQLALYWSHLNFYAYFFLQFCRFGGRLPVHLPGFSMWALANLCFTVIVTVYGRLAQLVE
ncbi:MAG: hypothetical protein KAS96_02965, partial [Planctomycetes bacterium]|nr:hypothetical protein [Planctomycetota bacterium]